MADTKNYGLKGVGDDVQFGKAGGRFVFNTGASDFRATTDGTTLSHLQVLTPVGDTDAATKLYVDNTAAGLDHKESVNSATTADAAATYNATNGPQSNGQFTSFPATIDGITLAENDRVLVKNQTNADENGIYVVTSTTTTLNRASDFDTDAEVTAGAFTFVEEGTVNADSGWVLQGPDPLTVGTGGGSDLNWVLFSTSSDILAGDAITKTGNTLNLDFVGGGGLTSATATAGGDFIAFSDTTGADAMFLRTWTNVLADLDIVNGGGNGILTRTAADTYTGRTITASATATEEGLVVTNGNGVSGEPTIGLDIQGTTSAGTNAANTDELILFDGTNNRAYSVLELSAAPAFDSAGTSIADADGDTQIQTEQSADEDIIRFDTGDNVTGYPAQGDALLFSSGQFTLALPTANVATTAGGLISLTSGIGNTTGNGGAVSVTSGAGGATGDGGLTTLAAGASGAGATGDGGAVAITAGASAATNGAGGAVAITSGAGNGSGADGLITISAGSVEALRFTGNGTSVIQTHEANVGLTADVGSAQGNGVITSTYNVYSIVGTTGDAATLPAVFPIGTLIYVKNDDAAESMDVFPASGDDAGNGTNTAVVVAAGESATFIATAADATWSVLITEGGAGSVPTVITVADSTDSTSFPAFFESATGDLGPKTDASNYTYNATTGALSAGSFIGGNLTDNRVLIAGTSGLIEDDSTLTYNGTTLVAASVTVSDLTDNRVVIAGTSGVLEDDGNFTFNGTTLALTAAMDITGDLDVDNVNINGNTVSTTTGDLNIQATGTSSVIINDGGGDPILELNNTVSAINGLAISAGATGNPAQITTGTGSEANIDIGFLTNGTGAIAVVAGSGNYEDNVTADDDIPNKKYVDDAIALTGGSGTLDSVTGTIDLTTASTQNIGAATGIPANCTILSTLVEVDTLSDAATTVTVGDATNGAASYMAATENDPEIADIYIADGRVANGGAARQATATVAVNGSVGAATCIITFRHV